jgi:hypothetical protein
MMQNMEEVCTLGLLLFLALASRVARVTDTRATLFLKDEATMLLEPLSIMP